jgi:hypothetical protein
MDEVPLFFRGAEDCALFGVLHRPAVRDAARPAFVFCHPLAEEKLWAHRVFVSYARQLAAAGYPVLRFDLTGNGDSEGQFSDLSLERACDDLRRAVDEVRRLTGVRSVRMTQMAIHKQVRQERPELVAEMEQGRTVNIDGYEMGWPLYSSVAALKLGSERRAFAGPCLIVQIDKQARPAADLQRLAAGYGSSALEFAQEEPFWKEIARFYQSAPNLFDVTSAWLSAR